MKNRVYFFCVVVMTLGYFLILVSLGWSLMKFNISANHSMKTLFWAVNMFNRSLLNGIFLLFDSLGLSMVSFAGHCLMVLLIARRWRRFFVMNEKTPASFVRLQKVLAYVSFLLVIPVVFLIFFVMPAISINHAARWITALPFVWIISIGITCISWAFLMTEIQNFRHSRTSAI
jgi:hypothetical protein